MERLTLIGMPGSGKSAVGRIAAERLGWSFVDTDRCIEERFGCPLQELVDRAGSEGFRRIEEETVLLLNPGERTVIATGGSVVYSEAAMQHLAAISTVVFLDVPVQVLERHISLDGPRGIVGMNGGGIDALNEERFPLYQKHAHLIVLLHTETAEEVAAKVLSRCGLAAGSGNGR